MKRINSFLVFTVITLNLFMLIACTYGGASGKQKAVSKQQYINTIYQMHGDFVLDSDDPHIIAVLIADESVYMYDSLANKHRVDTDNNKVMRQVISRLNAHSIPYVTSRRPGDLNENFYWSVSYDEFYIPIIEQ